MLRTNPQERFTGDLQYHIGAATRAFFANRTVLCDRQIPIAAKLKSFDALVSSVACFAGCHRTHKHSHSQVLASSFRKLIRQVVGAPPALDWSRPWHEIPHDWNMRALDHVSRAKIQCWSIICLRSYWRMASWIACLPADRWVRRALAWQPFASGRTGRPRNLWDSLLVGFLPIPPHPRLDLCGR